MAFESNIQPVHISLYYLYKACVFCADLAPSIAYLQGYCTHVTPKMHMVCFDVYLVMLLLAMSVKSDLICLLSNVLVKMSGCTSALTTRFKFDCACDS